jgi:hypothetical protein
MSKTTWLVIGLVSCVFALVGALNSGIRGAARYGATDAVLLCALVDGFINGVVWAAILAGLCWIGRKIGQAVK